MAKHISAYTGVKRISAPTMTAVSTDKQSTGKRVSAFRNYALDREIAEKKAGVKNKGGLIGGAGYTLEKGALGAIQNVEGAADFVTAGAADLVGADELAEKIMDDDWVDYGHADEWYNPDKGMQVVGDVSGAIGSMIPNLTVAGGTALVNAALTAVTHGGYAAAVPWVQRIVPSLYAGISAAGNATKEAYRQTGELGFKEWGYGGLVGATEAGVEALTAGIGKGTGRLVAKFGKKAVGEATEAVGKYGIKGLLKTLGGDMISEGFEEGFATFMSPIYAKATYDPDAEMATAGEVFYDTAIGSVAGLIFSGADVAVSFGSSVDAGKKVSEAGKADRLVKQATYGLAQIRVEMEGAQSKLADVEASNELTKWGKARQKKQIKRTAENRAQASKAIEEALLRWESLTPEQRKSVKGFEVLGDLQKNDFLLRANAWVETRAGALSEQSDEGLSRIAEQIRESTGETYTVEELRANKDDVLTRIACSMLAITGLENGEATQNAAQAGEDAAQGAESDGLTEWEGVRDNDDMTSYEARSEAEGMLLTAAVREGVPRASIPAMIEAYRADTSLSPEEFVDGWLDAVKLYGNGAAGHTSYAADSALGRMTESQRAAAMEQGRLYGEAQTKAKARAEGKAQTDTDAKAEAQKEKTSDEAEGRKYSADNSITEYSEYDKPITMKDVEILLSIGRKSINEFTSEDLKKAQKWAYKFYKELGVKSPFFRAWFGEWRAYDKSPARIVSFAYGEKGKLNYNSRKVYNADLKRKITIDDTVIEDSIHYATVNGDKKQILKLLGKVDEILAKGIFLDTKISEKKKGNKKGSTQFMHYLYTPISVNGAPFIAKLAVEEYDLTGQTRAYNLQRIEMSKLSRAQFSQIIDENREKYAYNSDALSVAQLLEFVKTLDKEFSAAPEVNEKLLNKDGTPKVFYHGTNAKFEAFDRKMIGSHTDDGIYGKGFYFSSHKKQAEQYGTIGTYYLRLHNPLVLSNYSSIEEVAELLDMSESCFSMNGGIVKPRYNFIPTFTSHVVSSGFDGVIVDYGTADEIVVFDPKQIKSATDNIGTFDGSENNIRWSDTGVSESNSSASDKPMKRTTRKGVPGVVLADGLNVRNDFSDRQYALYKAEEIMSKVLGVDIVFHRSLHHGANVAAGYFSQKDGSIHININAMRDGKNIALYTLGHETVHYIKKWSPHKYAELESFVLRKLRESGEDVNALRDAKREQLEKSGDLKGLTEEQAEALVREEVVAEAMEGVLSDGEVLAELQARHRSLWEKIRDFVLSVIEKVKAAFDDLSGASQTARVLKDTVDALDGMKRLFYEGVVEAAENSKVAMTHAESVSGTDTVVKHAILYPSFSSEQIQMNMLTLANMEAVSKIDKSKLEKTGIRPKDLFLNFFNKLGNRIYSSVFGDIDLSNASAKSEIRHGLTSEKIASIEAIPEVINQGKVIFQGTKNENHVERIVVCAPIKIGETDYYMGVMLQRDNQSQRLYLHSVVTIDASRKEMPTSSQANRVTNEAHEDDDHLFITSIIQKAIDVKTSAENSQKKNLESADKHSAGGDITESTDVYENEESPFQAAVRRSGIDPESGAMIRSIEESSKDLREDERAAWQKDVERLGSYVKAQKAAAVSPAFTPKAMENAVGKVMSVIGAKRGRAELTERMTELYRHIATSDTLTYEDIMERAEAIADELIEAQPPTPVAVDGVYGDILTDLKQTPMTLTSTQMQEVADRYGSYENFRRKMFGKWKLSKEGVDLDVLWQEWAGQYPEFFDPDMTEGDMVDALVKIYDEAYRAQNAVEYIEKTAVMQPLTMAIYNGYWELPAAPDPLYAAYQKDLAEQRGEADREQQRALARQRGEHKRAMAELQKQHERRIQKMNARMKELMRQKDRMELGQKVSAQTKEITVRTRAARRVLGRLNTMFFNQTKTKHVPQALRSLVEQVLSSEDLGDFQTLRKHMREISELESKIEQLEREPALTGEQQKKLDAMRYRYDELASASLAPKAQAEALFKAFEEYNQKTNKGAMLDADLMKRLSDDVKAMEGKPLSEMGVESVRAVEDFYKLLYHQIHNANTLFAEERAEQISQLGDASVKEVEGSKLLKFLSPKEMEWAGLSSVRSFILKNLKPLTVFEATGSKTLQGLFQRVLDGEGVWASDVQGVHEKIKGIREKYGWQSWKMDERVAVETKSGTVRLSLSEMMSLYAYSFREQAISHLEGGGFVLDPSATAKGKYPLKVLEQKVNDARRYVMDMETMGALASQLTEEQKSYVKEMQAVLSEMGALGNEVSRKLYDMDLFNEKHYFPIKVRSDYLESQTGRTGDPNIKNRGAFKQTVPDADNPLVLEAFDKVFSDHVNSMATYHAFVLPVEDLMRVFNYNPSNATIDEQGNWVADESAKSYSTVKAAISGRYGEDVVKYIEDVVRDLNGGARRDATASILDSGITAFKRASTMASLSVLIQQPTSLIRAGAYIDYKYLMNTKGFIDLKDHKANWERLCKYAPVGVIKEMGGYDTGVGARTTEYLNAKEYKTLSERAGAFFKPEALGGDANYRAEIFGRGAAFADEMAWIQMFEACVSEQAEKMKKPRDAEEVLTAAGERFTEIVRRTQVYDSTLTRSELMRSKDTGMKMATAFGAEPTTIVSMVADAIIRGERGDVKFLRKSGGALAAAIIINAMAVSLVYAMRDDDEDKTYAEKYLSTLSAEIVEGFIPLSYLPFARDVMSLAQGYEVERSDMTLIGNLFDQVKLLTSSKRSVTDKVLGVTGAVSAFFGLPVTNMVRDAKGLINTFLGRVDTERTTGAGVSTALKEEFTTIFGLFDEQTTNQYQLYDAVMRGDVAHYERVAARYDSEKAVEQALRKALRENDPRIHEAAVARMEGEREVYESLIAQIEGEGHFDRDIIIRAINNQINYINDHAEDETVPKDEAAAAEAEEELHEALYSASDLNAALERGDTEDFIAMADILVYYKIDAGKTEAQARASIKSSVTRYWKEKWIEAWKQNDTAEIKRIQSILTSTGLYGDRNQVAELGQGWVKAYAAKTGLVSVSGSQTAGTGRIRLGN